MDKFSPFGFATSPKCGENTRIWGKNAPAVRVSEDKMPILPCMNNKNFYFIVSPNPQKMLTHPHRLFWDGFWMKKDHKNDDYTQKVRVSERSIITVYIYIAFFETLRRAVNVATVTTFTSER